MWILPVFLTITTACVLTLILARLTRDESKVFSWDIPRVAGSYTTIVSSLSGFSVASAIFIANLRVNIRYSPDFESVIGLFLTGFIVLGGTAMMFATIPNFPTSARGGGQPGSTHMVAYGLAHICFFLGISSTWLGLQPLLNAIGLPNLAWLFSWILLFVSIAGTYRTAMYTYRLTRFGKLILFLIPGVSFTFATTYCLYLVPLRPNIWPLQSPPLAFMLVAFAIGSIGFGASTMMMQTMVAGKSSKRTRELRQDALLVYTQAAACAVAFLWWAVVTS